MLDDLTSIYRELDLVNRSTNEKLESVKETFNSRFDLTEEQFRREVKTIYYKIDDLLKLLNGRFDIIELKLEQNRESIDCVEDDLRAHKNKLDNQKDKWFWDVFIRIGVTVSAGLLVFIVSQIIKGNL